MVLPPDHQKKFGSVGLLLSNLEARLVDENGEDVSKGEPGEMWIRGPTIMKVSAHVQIGTCSCVKRFLLNWMVSQGYLNNPEATTASFAPGGWYKTGDVLRRDEDGYYYIVDRKKELIKFKVRTILCDYGKDDFVKINEFALIKGYQGWSQSPPNFVIQYIHIHTMIFFFFYGSCTGGAGSCSTGESSGCGCRSDRGGRCLRQE